MDENALRDELADRLKTCGAIESSHVEHAFRRVSRDRYLDQWYRYAPSSNGSLWTLVRFDRTHPKEEALREIYSDQPLVTCLAGSFPSSSTSQPSLVARMLELLDLRPGMRILEIGTGTGYNAALLSEIIGVQGSIVSIESQEAVARRADKALQQEGYANVRVVHADGFAGFDADAPYDRIVATVGCNDISPHWIEQVAADGHLLVPLVHGDETPLVAIHRTDHPDEGEGRVRSRSAFMEAEGLLRSGRLWSSFLLPGAMENEIWRRPLPVLDTTTSKEEGGRRDGDLKFYLALCTRHLWRSEVGYGIADPASRVSLLISEDQVVGYGDDRRVADRLYETLEDYLIRWDSIGRPRVTDYSMKFLRRERLAASESREVQWIVCRPNYAQIIWLDREG